MTCCMAEYCLLHWQKTVIIKETSVYFRKLRRNENETNVYEYGVNTVTFPFFAKLAEQKKITPDMLYPFIDVHRHTQVTDFVMNIFAQCSTASSDTQLDYEDIYEAALDGGAGTPFDKVQWWKGIYEIQKIHGIDIYEVWIILSKRCVRECCPI